MKKQLTEKQQNILNALKGKRKGLTPTEVGMAIGFEYATASAAVNNSLQRLIKEGYVVYSKENGIRYKLAKFATPEDADRAQNPEKYLINESLKEIGLAHTEIKREGDKTFVVGYKDSDTLDLRKLTRAQMLIAKKMPVKTQITHTKNMMNIVFHF